MFWHREQKAVLAQTMLFSSVCALWAFFQPLVGRFMKRKTTSVFQWVREERERPQPETRSVEPILSRFFDTIVHQFVLSWMETFASFAKHLCLVQPKTFGQISAVKGAMLAYKKYNLWRQGTQGLVWLSRTVFNTIGQRFSNWGPRTKGGPREDSEK